MNCCESRDLSSELLFFATFWASLDFVGTHRLRIDPADDRQHFLHCPRGDLPRRATLDVRTPDMGGQATTRDRGEVIALHVRGKN
jgi:hypothetical protein